MDRTPHRIPVDGLRWIAIRVTHSLPTVTHEFIVVDELVSIGIVAYCPIGSRWSMWDRVGRARRKVPIVFPIFSRYVFAGLTAGQRIQRRTDRYIEAVLSDGSGPLSIPPAVIREINARELAGEWDDTRSWWEKSPYRVGEEVRIAEGPFSGFPATVDALQAESRIRLLVNIFGRSTPVCVDPCQLQSVDVAMAG